jgi:hypothetical protein
VIIRGVVTVLFLLYLSQYHCLLAAKGGTEAGTGG